MRFTFFFFVFFESAIAAPPISKDSVDANLNSIASCEDLSDQFCSDLWNEKNFGNLERNGIKIFLGNTPKEALSVLQKIDLEALIESEKSVDSDLRKNISTPLDQLKEHLLIESDSTPWTRKLTEILVSINSAIEDTAEERTHKRRPEFKILKRSDRKIAEKIEFQKDLTELSNHVLVQKYKNHPNWKRVENIYPKVKRYLAEAIQKLPFENKTKKSMLSKLTSVRLSLPIEDPKSMRAQTLCDRSPVNAFYFQQSNQFTVCPGYFNALQSEGAMFGVIAHELSHSIDPFSLRDEEFKRSKLYTLTKELAQQQGALECKEWSKLKATSFPKNLSFLEMPKKLDQLTQCFVDRTQLTPLRWKNLHVPLKSATKNYMNSVAAPRDLSLLASPMIYKKGRKELNPFYWRPDLLEMSVNKNAEFNTESGTLYITHVFVQELSCLTQNHKISPHKKIKDVFAELSIPEQIQLFEAAIKMTNSLVFDYLKSTASYFGTEMESLQSFNLSKPSNEFWADWLALKATEIFLKEQDTLERKRNNFLASAAIFCEPSGLDKLVPHFLTHEKEYSLESHPENRSRRLSFFTKEIQKILECNFKDAHLKQQKQCELHQ